MHSNKTIRIKICCISSIEEARIAIKYGASALGLVSEMPSGPGVISDELIAEIVAMIPPGVATFLLTSKRDVESIVWQHQKCRTSTIQIVDELKKGSYSELKAALPGIKIVQVIHVTGMESLEKAVAIAPKVDAILLDSGNPNLQVKELGGTGRRHDWEISRKICEAIDKPLYLAGGLKPENVAEAVAKVQPFGLDICSGVRTDGKLDEQKVKSLFENLKEHNL